MITQYRHDYELLKLRGIKLNAKRNTQYKFECPRLEGADIGTQKSDSGTHQITTPIKLIKTLIKHPSNFLK